MSNAIRQHSASRSLLTIAKDDGVKVNYPKLGAALKKIPGLEAKDDE